MTPQEVVSAAAALATAGADRALIGRLLGELPGADVAEVVTMALLFAGLGTDVVATVALAVAAGGEK